MSRCLTSPLLWAVPGVCAVGLWWSQPAEAVKSRRATRHTTATHRSKTRLASAKTRSQAKGQLPPPRVAATKNLKPLPRFVSLDTLDTLRLLRETAQQPLLPVLQPLDFETEKPLTQPMTDLLSPIGPQAENPIIQVSHQASPHLSPSLNGQRIAQRFPRPIPPAPIPGSRRTRPAAPIIPRFVRYPLEFQLCGIALGTRAVDKDQFNRIDRYGLFALHGNPTAIVVPGATGGSVTVSQQAPEYGASLFEASQNGYLPDWAAAVTVNIDNNHVEWLYRRSGYSMGFVVDRLGYVDAIVAAGVSSPIARTQLEDPVHTVKLGDDLRKVLFRYGYPDTIETYSINAIAGTTVQTDAGAGGTNGAGTGTATNSAANTGGNTTQTTNTAQTGAAGGGAGGGTTGATAGNSAYRTFEVRYEQSYNVVFTIRNNRVVRMYIFGDPDFFNALRRRNLRTRY